MTDTGYRTRHCPYCNVSHPVTEQFFPRYPSGGFKAMCLIEARKRKRAHHAEMKKRRRQTDGLLRLAVSARWA